MQALILAAGMGKRLKDLTRENTKCMIRVNGETLIERMLSQLDRLGLSRIVLVIGYQGEKLKAFCEGLPVRTPLVFVENTDYETTNNIYSLYLARERLCEDDTLLLESDLIFEDGILEALLSDERETLALVDRYESWMDGTCVRITTDDRIEAFIPKSRFRFEEIADYYKTVNIYKFSRHFSATHYVPFLDAYSRALGNNAYYEQVLRVITMLDEPEIRAKRLCGELWYEIDDAQDLDIAASMFVGDEDGKVDRIGGRFGGYWRYPGLLDFCYLVNPFYPPRRLMDELKANFEKLVTNYPSGQEVQSLLAAKDFDLKTEQIVVGNGASELISALFQRQTGKIGFIRPSFEEYKNRYPEDKCVFFDVRTSGFRYGAKELTDFFRDKELSALVLVNPDNPSGNYLSAAETKKLLTWTREQGIRLILDESFSDFSEEGKTFLDTKLLEAHPSLIVIKSISKSYGVPGLRLGLLASGDRELIKRLKKEVSIWNINSFAEFYLQIEEKYHDDYEEALDKLRAERERFSDKLKALPKVTVFPSEANYLMVELKEPGGARRLTRELLTKKSILVKDLTKKTGGEYLRLAIRLPQENDRLVKAMKELL
ncbi:MAG: aminotransferase class I/II-fold pyridoxal phosphate-dependent enzyme [Lachnospiraceae bacterium]|nr:aminotransferase class I/II-fold pyridoxal phosphate-dependent enzyme [Lachnospiraceae bacterium]